VSSPLVSVIVPCYNHARFLPEAIDSALAQTYPRVEVVVVNDGSPDDTAQVCRRYEGRIVYVEQQNKGLAEARNAGIRVAKGEFILPLDADDKIAGTFLQKTLPLIAQAQDVGFVYTDTVFFAGPYSQEGVVLSGWDRSWSLARMLEDNLSNCTAVYRRADWEQVGGYCREFLHGLEDWDFWLQIVDLGKSAEFLNEPLFFYRQHVTGGMINSLIENDYAASYALMVRRHQALFQPHWDTLLGAHAARGVRCYREWKRFEALYYQERTGRLEKFGVPLPLARAFRRLLKRR
jgi:glycosyltransferase involved in cell wall biosynthesis